MPSRAEDWFRQASRDLDHARRSLSGGDFEWACFAAQQAAEKALKALYQKAGAEARGHAVNGLLEKLPPAFAADPGLAGAARLLDRHYIPARYPNAYPEGAPHEYYTKADAEEAIANAERILLFCESHLS
mgnify:FL=1